MAFGSVTESDILTVDGDFEFFVASGQAIAIQLTPRETAALKFNVDGAGTTDDLEIEILQGHRISSGTRPPTASQPTTTSTACLS